MSDDRDPIGNLGLPDPVDIRLHQGAADLLALMIRQHSQRVNGNRATAFFMADDLPIFKGPALVGPVRRETHRSVCHVGLRGTCGNNVTNQSCTRLGLVFVDNGQSEKPQTEFRASAEAVDELLRSEPS